jgi:hypothetical protein
VVAVSLHGRHVAGRGPAAEHYGVPESWDAIAAAARGPAGYGHAGYAGQPGYGISLCRPGWVAGLVESLGEARLVLYGERLWDGHHDVLALQRGAAHAATG